MSNTTKLRIPRQSVSTKPSGVILRQEFTSVGARSLAYQVVANSGKTHC
mgnify:CR=1 FL=1